jgi:toxin ParE1/3/4
MKPTKYDPGARDDLEDAVAFYENSRRGLGLEFEAEVDATMSHIRENPQIGFAAGRKGARQLPLQRFPYSIYFLELDETVWILAIAHHKRKSTYWKRRDPN